ncbi:MAG: ATP-binding cassette domain-containing protein [Campylobacterota bacterium]|nr:ATP-binding cassette domain-containing protein [Campylobacterota bacterium]
MNIVEVNNLSYSYDYELFSEISFNLQEKRSMAIVGESGSGKSTLLHLLSTLLKPQSGEIKLFEKDISKLNSSQIETLRRDELGIIFQAHYLFKGFSAYENLEVAAILANESIDEELIKRLKIEHVVQNRVTKLSGGQEQRVSIARVLTKKPRLILADEPTGNLDQQTALEVMTILNEYIETNSASLIVVTHDMSLANRCDAIYKIENKKFTKIK